MVASTPLELASQLAQASSVMLMGAMDTGKTTLARAILQDALEHGRSVAYVDADIGNSTVGPPTCVALKLVTGQADVDSLETPDRLHFVGGISPDRLVLQHVIGVSVLVEAVRSRADLVLVDTTGTVSGVVGETLKYHKVELVKPERVVALQRGGELEPIVGMLRRFFSADVLTTRADPEVLPASPDERAARRADKLREAFRPPLERWRVRPTVFAPTLPMGLDLSRLDGVLVGVQDGTGACLGLGRLEHEDGILRVLTNAGEGMQGLRLGSLRIDLDTFGVRPINLRELIFGI